MFPSNAQKVTIRIRGTQYDPGDMQQGNSYAIPADAEIERTESVAQGAYYVRNGAHYLLWEERLESVDAPVRSRLKYRDGCLEVTRRGGMEARLVFEAGKICCTDYTTLLGVLRMEIAADRVELEEDADGTRKICTAYRLCHEGGVVAYCELDIEIKQRKA